MVELLEPYKEGDDGDSFTIHGSDSRGSYYVYDLAAFRDEYEQRGEQLLSNTIKAYGYDAHGFYMFTVYYSRKHGRGHAEITGGNEIVVNGLATRIDQLGTEASERRKARKKARQTEVTSTHVALSLDAPASTPWWNNTWLVTVGGGVIAALIVALIVWLISSH